MTLALLPFLGPHLARAELRDPQGAAVMNSGSTSTRCGALTVEQVTAYEGIQDLHGVSIVIRTQNEVLDGEIEEVGFHHRIQGTGYFSPRNPSGGWTNRVLDPVMGAKDRFELPLNFSALVGTASYEGSFYVKTSKGSQYWLRSQRGGDFTFDERTHELVRGFAGLDHPMQASRPELRQHFSAASCH